LKLLIDSAKAAKRTEWLNTLNLASRYSDLLQVKAENIGELNTSKI